MRIIAGLAKGRKLISPSDGVRPTSDRAREALFSTLESEFGSISELCFLDLYCGSGAVSAEALSRGASVVEAVDRDAKAISVAKENHELLKKIPGVGSSSIIQMPIKRYLENMSTLKFDIVFLDPPYDATASEVTEALNLMVENGFLKKGSIVAMERDSKSKPINWPPKLIPLKERKYGAATIFYAEAC
jgi:16S rRNA (guanine966-N2)-methyltransferase